MHTDSMWMGDGSTVELDAPSAVTAAPGRVVLPVVASVNLDSGGVRLPRAAGPEGQ